MTTLRIRVTNSFDGTTFASSVNTEIAQNTGTDSWFINAIGGGSLADIGILPLSYLKDKGILVNQDYAVSAYIDTGGAPAVSVFTVGSVAIEGPTVFPVFPPRTTDPSNANEGPRVDEIHLAGDNYGLSVLTSGAVGTQILVLEFVPLHRLAQLTYDGGSLDGLGTGSDSTPTSNVQISPRLDIVVASADSCRYVHTGPAKTIQRIGAVIQAGTVAGAAALITWGIVPPGGGAAVPVTASTLTLNVADTVNDYSISSPSGANILAEGATLVGTVAGGNTGAGSLAAVSMQLA